jgi:hypothetical protein
MGETARGSKIIKFKPGAPPRPASAFRWHAVQV